VIEALRVAPPEDALMVTVVEPATALVPRLKLALVAPAATVTPAGTVTAALLLESVTCAPPAGAGPSSVTVPVAALPPVRVVGVRLSDETLGGITVSEVVSVAPPYDAEIVAGVDAATGLVVRLNVALVPPGETVTLAATATAGLLLESATCAPPAGAGPFSITVPVAGLPPATLAGLTISDETLGGITVSDAVCVAPP
jgi:hypothetical protein